MTVSAKWYGKAFLSVFNKEIDWEADAIRVALCTDSYTPDQDAHDYFDDIDNEVSGTGYSSEGELLANASLTYTAGTNVMKLDGDDVTWSSSSITARYAIIYLDTGTPGTSPLICYVDFGADVTSTNGDFTITWSADGIAKITVS